MKVAHHANRKAEMMACWYRLRPRLQAARYPYVEGDGAVVTGLPGPSYGVPSWE